MKTFLQHKAWKIGLALLILLLAQMGGEGTQKASADMSPPPAPTGAGFYPVGETSNVRMMSEYVLLDIAGYSSHRAGHANVTAEFVMRNLGDVAEQMQARFPLTYSTFNRAHWDRHPEDIPASELCLHDDYYPPLSEFQVWVNNESVEHTTHNEIVTTRDPESGDYVNVSYPCWENFNVTFPPGQDVYVKITYVVPGYWSFYGTIFEYVLETGAGWRDTIGKATIVARLPYEINAENMYRCWPSDCTISSTDVTWHYEDFEPEFNIGIRVIEPEVWLTILTEKENVRTNPNDGEAWGRLGKAYKDALEGLMGLPDYDYAANQTWFNLSYEAYTNAITLLPEDADWHYGFAELLCYRAFLTTETVANWYACAEQIKFALDINPNHEGANGLLELLSYFVSDLDDFIHLGASGPNYLVLTQTTHPGTPQLFKSPTPTVTMTGTPPTSTPTSTRTPSKTNVPTREPGWPTPTPWYTRTPTAKPSKTATPGPTSTPEPQSTPTRPVAATATSTPAAPSSSSTPAFIGAGVLLVALAVAVIVVRGRRGQ